MIKDYYQSQGEAELFVWDSMEDSFIDFVIQQIKGETKNKLFEIVN